jgi:hypothetical protein
MLLRVVSVLTAIRVEQEWQRLPESPCVPEVLAKTIAAPLPHVVRELAQIGEDAERVCGQSAEI